MKEISRKFKKLPRTKIFSKRKKFKVGKFSFKCDSHPMEEKVEVNQEHRNFYIDPQALEEIKKGVKEVQNLVNDV